MDIAKKIQNVLNCEEYVKIRVFEKAIDFIKEKLDNEVLWVYDDETEELFLFKKPESFTEALSGLGKEM